MATLADTFDQRFQALFDNGVADIKFFVRRNPGLTFEDLRSEALGFQQAIDSGAVTAVDSVDKDLQQVDFDADW